MTSDSQLATLIISTLVALNHANFIGNYSVLREIASPNFQASKGSGRLSGIFTELRDRRFDFSPIILLQPKLVRTPSIDRSGRLPLTGYLETVPEKLNFDLLFEPVGGRWRLFGIGANTTFRSNLRDELGRSLAHESPGGPGFLRCSPKRQTAYVPPCRILAGIMPRRMVCRAIANC